MDAHLQRIERQRAFERYHKLAIDHEGLRLERAKHGHHFGIIARQGLARFCPEIDLVPGAESETTKTIPFRLELPAWLRGKFADELRLHGLGADRHGKALQQRNGHTLVFALLVVRFGVRLTHFFCLVVRALLSRMPSPARQKKRCTEITTGRRDLTTFQKHIYVGAFTDWTPKRQTIFHYPVAV